MVNKHFIKTLILFIAMILVGLTSAFLISHFDIANKNSNTDSLATDPCPVKPTKPC